MLIQQGETRSDKADRRLALTLAAVAGALNTAGFYAAGLYTGNMTGNLSSVSDNLGTGDLMAAGRYAALVALFVVGAMTSTLLINAGRQRKQVGIYAFSILAEAVLLAALGCADRYLPGYLRGPVLAFGLSFLMGLQNSVVTLISNARVRTTHVTGMLTDIGIELGQLFDASGQPSLEAEMALNRSKLRLHWQTVASFLGGGVIGVVAYRAVADVLLFGCSGLLLFVSLRQVWLVRLKAS